MKWKISVIIFILFLFSLASHKIIAQEKYTFGSTIGKSMKTGVKVLGIIAPDDKIRLALPMSKKSFEHFNRVGSVKFQIHSVPYLYMTSWSKFADASQKSTNDLLEIIANLNARVDELEGRVAELENKRR